MWSNRAAAAFDRQVAHPFPRLRFGLEVKLIARALGAEAPLLQ
jgi:hypothetical protein